MGCDFNQYSLLIHKQRWFQQWWWSLLVYIFFSDTYIPTANRLRDKLKCFQTTHQKTKSLIRYDLWKRKNKTHLKHFVFNIIPYVDCKHSVKLQLGCLFCAHISSRCQSSIYVSSSSRCGRISKSFLRRVRSAFYSMGKRADTSCKGHAAVGGWCWSSSSDLSALVITPYTPQSGLLLACQSQRGAPPWRLNHLSSALCRCWLASGTPCTYTSK